MTIAPAEAFSNLEQKRIKRARSCFEAGGPLTRWPSKRAEQLLVLWVLWSRFPSSRQFAESEVNSMLRDWNTYEDFVLLRRELCDLDLLRRTPNGSHYVRIEQVPPPDAAALIDQMG